MNHSHILYDADPHFKIDPITRKITNESSSKTTLMQHDHNSERFTFEVKRHVEGHDLLQCNVVEIHYINVESNTKLTKSGVYTVYDLMLKPNDDDTVVCSWEVGSNATQLVGQLQFLIRFACINEDTGHIDYVWNTGVYNGVSISSGIYNGEVTSDNRVPAFNFITTISGDILKFFVGTQAQYDELTYEDKRNLFAIITDDKSKEEIEAELNEVKRNINNTDAKLNELTGGGASVKEAEYAVRAGDAERADNATHAVKADEATRANNADKIVATYKRVTTGSEAVSGWVKVDLEDNTLYAINVLGRALMLFVGSRPEYTFTTFRAGYYEGGNNASDLGIWYRHNSIAKYSELQIYSKTKGEYIIDTPITIIRIASLGDITEEEGT